MHRKDPVLGYRGRFATIRNNSDNAPHHIFRQRSHPSHKLRPHSLKHEHRQDVTDIARCQYKHTLQLGTGHPTVPTCVRQYKSLEQTLQPLCILLHRCPHQQSHTRARSWIARVFAMTRAQAALLTVDVLLRLMRSADIHRW